MEQIQASEGTRPMQYAISKAQRLHEEREDRIQYVRELLNGNPEMERAEALSLIRGRFNVSMGAAVGYYSVAQARISGAASPREPAKSAPAKPITVNGMRYYSNSTAARYLRINPVTLAYWGTLGKGVKPSVVTNPKNGKTYRLYAKGDIDVWRDSNAELLAGVHKVRKVYKKHRKAKVKKSVAMPVSSSKKPAVPHGMLAGSAAVAEYLGTTNAILRHAIIKHGHPVHTVIPRTGRAMYAYWPKDVVAWTNKHRLFEGKRPSIKITAPLPQLKEVISRIVASGEGAAIDKRTRELTEAAQKAQAALIAWLKRVNELVCNA